MIAYTTKPSKQWPGYIDIFEDGQYHGSAPADRVQEFIEHAQTSHRKHWDGIIQRRDTLIIAGGCAYSIGPESGRKDIPSHCKGFGGDLWLIKFTDGRIVLCDSLWHLGEVPNEYRDRLPDNAVLTSPPRCAGQGGSP